MIYFICIFSCFLLYLKYTTTCFFHTSIRAFLGHISPSIDSKNVYLPHEWLSLDILLTSNFQQSQECYHLQWSLRPPQYHQLDHAPDVSFHGHWSSQRFHGFMVGLAQKSFTINSNQLVIHSQTAILRQRGENSVRQENMVW